MFRVTLACESVPTSAGQEAASDIQKEFAEHRPHHKTVVCAFTNGELVLTAENDFESPISYTQAFFEHLVGQYPSVCFRRKADIQAVSKKRGFRASNSAESPAAFALKTLAYTRKTRGKIRGIGDAQFDWAEAGVHFRPCALSPNPFPNFVSSGFTAGRCCG